MVLHQARLQAELAEAAPEVAADGARAQCAAGHAVRVLVAQLAEHVDEQPVVLFVVPGPVLGVAHDEGKGAADLKMIVEQQSKDLRISH